MDHDQCFGSNAGCLKEKISKKPFMLSPQIMFCTVPCCNNFNGGYLSDVQYTAWFLCELNQSQQFPSHYLKDLSNHQQSLLSDFKKQNFLDYIVFKNTLI